MGQMLAREVLEEAQRLSVAVIVLVRSGAAAIERVHARMSAQTLQPDLLLFVLPAGTEPPASLAGEAGVQFISAPPGTAAQRNAALDIAVERHDIIVFYDENFIPARTSIAGIERFFRTHPEVAGATGNILADHATDAGLVPELAEQVLERHDSHESTPNCVVAPLPGLDIANMAWRGSAIGATRFDEAIAIDAWREEHDFTAALRKRGRIVHTFAFAGVQLAPEGATDGSALGYAQIANAVHLVRKGALTRGQAIALVLGDLVANHRRMLGGRSKADWAGRAAGNWRGLVALARGRLGKTRS